MIPKSSGPPGEMPFLDHLEELRWRLLYSVVAVVVCAIIGLVIVTQLDVLGILTSPLEPYLDDPRLSYTNPIHPFLFTLKLAIFVGLLLASPIVVYHTWAFLSPALHPGEKKAILPTLYFGLVLFLSGVAMGYFVALPATLKFTMGFQTEFLVPEIMVSEYLGFVTGMLLAFGIVFELPVVILALTFVGLVTPEFLADKRRHALAIITVGACVITPGDVITVTLMMMVPLALLYELSIFLSKIVVRKRRLAEPLAAGG